MQFRAALAPFGSFLVNFYAISGRFGYFGRCLAHFYAISARFAPFRTIFKPFLYHFGAFLTIFVSFLCHFGPIWHISGHFWLISMPFKAALAHFGPFLYHFCAICVLDAEPRLKQLLLPGHLFGHLLLKFAHIPDYANDQKFGLTLVLSNMALKT